MSATRQPSVWDLGIFGLECLLGDPWRSAWRVRPIGDFVMWRHCLDEWRRIYLGPRLGIAGSEERTTLVFGEHRRAQWKREAGT